MRWTEELGAGDALSVTMDLFSAVRFYSSQVYWNNGTRQYNAFGMEYTKYKAKLLDDLKISEERERILRSALQATLWYKTHAPENWKHRTGATKYFGKARSESRDGELDEIWLWTR